jgi:hypothetical protein
MPIIINVDHEQQLVRALAIGPVTFEDIRAHVSQEHHWHGLSYPELIDARGAGPSLDPSEVNQLLDLVRPMANHTHLGRTAVLVSTDYAFGIVGVVEKLVEEYCEIKAFRDEDEALKWLTSKSIAAR